MEELLCKDRVNDGVTVWRFDTVLVSLTGNDVAGEGGLQGIRVGRLRLIFKVPEAHEPDIFGRDVPGHLALVEWFTELPTRTNSVNGMFPLRWSYTHGGSREMSIVQVIDIRRACQLFPKFGRENVDRALTPTTVLDAYEDFFLNNRMDKDAFRSIFWEVDDGLITDAEDDVSEAGD